MFRRLQLLALGVNGIVGVGIFFIPATVAASAPGRGAVAVFALVGLAASLASLYVHLQLLANPSYTSFCDVNATVSCTQAYLSKYGSVFGIPVAVLGVVWAVAMVGLTLPVAWGSPSRPPA